MVLKQPAETDLYMYGWGVPTFDSNYVFTFLYHTREGNMGSSNGTGYSNKAIDAKIQTLNSETDTAKRNQTIADIWKVLKDEVIYIPVHNQMLAYAMKPTIDIPVDVSNTPKLKAVQFKN
ncbi:MAG: hypothetical protein FGM26_12035 [Beijerinckiaceae bacterium]|nr:hypothetical protein [Beijerinckiaceae bacterium]